MIAVPAVWALTSLAISLCVTCAYVSVVFVVLFVALWAALRFVRVVVTFVTGYEYD